LSPQGGHFCHSGGCAHFSTIQATLVDVVEKMMTNRKRVTFVALSVLLGASLEAFAQGQPDHCADAFFAWQYSRCESAQAIDGRRARGMPEPAHPEDPMVIRQRRVDNVNARADRQSPRRSQEHGGQTASKATRPE
jgi:hypothetical protein